MKRTKRRKHTSVTHRIPTTSSYATLLHSSSYLQHQRPVHRIRTYPSFNGIQLLQHEKTILEVNKVTKLHKRDTTSSYDDFLRYTHPHDFILLTSTTHPVHNETPKAYSEQATLSIFIHEGRPTTTKLTLVDLPSSTNHSTCYECSKGIPFLLLTSHRKPLTKQVVIILYSPHLGRKVDIYYSLEEGKGIYTQEVNLLDFKAHYDLPSWYPIFQLPYQTDAKVTCTGFYVFIEIIYIDSSPDPGIFEPYVYNEPRDEFLQHLYDGIGDAHYISDD